MGGRTGDGGGCGSGLLICLVGESGSGVGSVNAGRGGRSGLVRGVGSGSARSEIYDYGLPFRRFDDGK